MICSRILVASVASVSIAGAASSADLPTRKPAPEPILSPIPAFSWTGFYIGGNVGVAFDGGVSNYSGYGFRSASTAVADYIQNNEGSNSVFTGGLMAGYNVQLSSIVFGLETDINYLGNIRSHNSQTLAATGAGLAPAGTYTFNTGRNANYYGTLRPRLGYAFDRFLVYGAGGFAYAGNDGSETGSVSYTSPAGAVTNFNGGGSGSSHTGYVVGGGIEYAFTNNILARAEYLYVNLGNLNNTFTTPTGATYYVSNNVREDFSAVRFGLSYKF